MSVGTREVFLELALLLFCSAACCCGLVGEVVPDQVIRVTM